MTAATKNRRSTKVLLGTALLAGAVGLTGLGAFALFTDTESTRATTTDGKLDIVATADYTVTNVAPGDAVRRTLDISMPLASNSGDLIESLQLSIPTPATADNVVGTPVDTGKPDSPAITTGQSLFSGTNGLSLSIQSCNGGTWSLPAAGTTAATGASCVGGTIATVLAATKLDSISTSAITLTPANFGFGTAPTFVDGTTLRLLTTFTLPSTADNGYEGASLTTTLNFAVTQRAGINK